MFQLIHNERLATSPIRRVTFACPIAIPTLVSVNLCMGELPHISKTSLMYVLMETTLSLISGSLILLRENSCKIFCLSSTRTPWESRYFSRCSLLFALTCHFAWSLRQGLKSRASCPNEMTRLTISD